MTIFVPVPNWTGFLLGFVAGMAFVLFVGAWLRERRKMPNGES